MQQNLIELVLVFTWFGHGRNVCATWHMFCSFLNLMGDAVSPRLCMCFITGSFLPASYFLLPISSSHFLKQVIEQAEGHWTKRDYLDNLSWTAIILWLHPSSFEGGWGMLFGCLVWGFFKSRCKHKVVGNLAAPEMSVLRTRSEIGFVSDFA